MDLLKKAKLAKEALALIAEKPKLKTTVENLKWTQRAFALIGQSVEKIKPSITDSEDYQYLQQVINSQLPDMNAVEIGNRLIEIVTRNAGATDYLSYIKQAVASYRRAFMSASKQFLLG